MEQLNPDEMMEGMMPQPPAPKPLARDPRLVKVERRIVQEIMGSYRDESLEVPLSLRDSPAQVVFPVMAPPEIVSEVPGGASFSDQVAGQLGADSFLPDDPFASDDPFAGDDPFSGLEADLGGLGAVGDPFAEGEFLL